MPAGPTHLNKSQRLVRMIELMQQPGGVSADVIRQRFELDARTLHRYLSDIRELGIPLTSTGRAQTRNLSIDASYRRNGVQINLLELISLRFGRQQCEFLRGTGFAQDMDEALETISTLSIDGEREVASWKLDRKLIAVPEHRKDHTAQADLIEEMLTALLRENPARAHYSRVGGRMRSYVLHPYTLATFRQGLYLFALDVAEDRVKTFAVDRFRSFERVRREHFDYPEDYDPHALVADAFGIITGPVDDVVLQFNRRAAPYIHERIWHESQVLEQQPGGGVRLSMRVGIAHELISWVLGFGPDVLVEHPASLAERVQHLHQVAAARLLNLDDRRGR